MFQFCPPLPQGKKCHLTVATQDCSANVVAVATAAAKGAGASKDGETMGIICDWPDLMEFWVFDKKNSGGNQP